MTVDVSHVTRNFSPWASWMVEAGRHRAAVDPLPPRIFIDARRRGGRGSGHGSTSCSGRLPAPVPLDLEMTDSDVVPVERDGYRRDRVVFDTEATMSVPAYLLVPDDRRRAGPGRAGHPRPRPRQVARCAALERPTSHPTATTPISWPPRLRRAGARPAVLRRAARLEPAGPLRLRHQPGARGDGGRVAARRQPVGPVALPRRARRAPAGRPVADRRGRPVLRRHRARCSSPRSTSGCAAAVVSGYFSSWAESHKMPWNMCGSQVLPGMLGQLRARRPRRAGRAAPAAGRVGRARRSLFPLAAVAGTVVEVAGGLRPPRRSPRSSHDVFDGDHQWHGERAYPFLDRWLPLTPRPKLGGGVEIQVQDDVVTGAQDRRRAAGRDRAGERVVHRLAPCGPRARWPAPSGPAAAPGS